MTVISSVQPAWRYFVGILDLASIGINELTSLYGCAGWSAPLLFMCIKIRFSCNKANSFPIIYSLSMGRLI